MELQPPKFDSHGTDAAATLRYLIQWFAAAFVLSLILYATTLNAFFIDDEVSNLVAVAPQAGRTWADTFGPVSNGFWRIAMQVTFRLLAMLFGLTPLPFHLTCLLVHSVAAALVGLLAWRIVERPAAGWIAALLFTAHLGAYGSGIMVANIGDSFLAIAVLVGLLAWDRWLDTDRRRWLAATFLAYLFAIASKETAVVFPILLFLWMLVRGQTRRRRVWIALGVVTVTAAAYGALGFYMQSTRPGSYLDANRLIFSPKNFARQLADYTISTLIPFLHVVEWPVRHFSLPHPAYWTIRFGVLGVLAVVGVRFVRRPRGRWLHWAVLSAATGLLLPSLLTGRPQVRFLYVALPFTCIGLSGAIVWWSGARRMVLMGFVAIMWTLFVAGFYTSTSLAYYRRATASVERFVREVQRISPQWEPHATVAIFDYPQPGTHGQQWVACQIIFNLFILEADARLSLDRITPETRYAYRFDGERLVEVSLDSD